MKIKIISIHDIGTNFGTTLQACALWEFLHNDGYDVEVIDYKPKYAYNKGKLGQLIKSVLFFKDVRIQKRRFTEYYREHIKLTKRYSKYSQLAFDETADIYIVGSDQVWNEFYDAGRDDAYYLDFTNCPRKMSYASSLGQLHDEEVLLRLKKKIRDFSFVAVRERASERQLHDIGLTQVKHVLDPVFLFEKDHYIDTNYINKYGDYLLIYAVHTDKFMDKVATEIAERLNLKIVLVGGFIQKFNHDYYLRDIGANEFVNLINNSKYFVANSFHATALSIILNKQFALVSPYYSPLRLTDILEIAQIENRIINCEEDISKAMDSINYDEVNKIIEPLRTESQNYLLDSLEELSKRV